MSHYNTKKMFSHIKKQTLLYEHFFLQKNDLKLEDNISPYFSLKIDNICFLQELKKLRQCNIKGTF